MRTKNSMFNMAAAFGSQIITVLLGFISRTVFITALGAEYLGVNGLFTNILSIISLAESGIGSSIVYSLYKPVAENDEEKILTKTMINNYAKGKLLLPIKNKKYSKEHIILMSLIYNLKGALSINDIKLCLDEIINKSVQGNYPLRELYSSFLEECDNDEKSFKIDVSTKFENISNKVDENKNFDGEFEKNFLLLCSLVNMSNMYRRMSEKLIDEFFAEGK